jgi:hypothetical protein
MQMVRITLEGTTVHQNGPGWEPGVWLGAKCIVPEVKDIIMIPPGEPFDVSIVEAKRLLRQWGGSIVTDPPPPILVEALKAHDDAIARSFGPAIPRDDPPRPSGAIFEIHHGRVE